MAISYGTVAGMFVNGEIGFITALPFILNLCLMLFRTTALVEMALGLTTIVWGMIAIYPNAHWIAYAQIPCLVWLLLTILLQLLALRGRR